MRAPCENGSWQRTLLTRHLKPLLDALERCAHSRLTAVDVEVAKERLSTKEGHIHDERTVICLPSLSLQPTVTFPWPTSLRPTVIFRFPGCSLAHLHVVGDATRKR